MRDARACAKLPAEACANARERSVMTAAPTPLQGPAHVDRIAGAAWARQLLWLPVAAIVGFLVPYVFADVLGLERDAYYAIHVAAVAALFLAWARRSRLSVREMLVRRWPWALLAGVAAGAALAAIVFTFGSTSHPGGPAFAGEILWRGVVYGAADGLLLGAFPVLVVFAAFPFLRGRAHTWRTLGTGALALLAALAITAAYHAGYRDFRGAKLTTPMRGTAIWTAPTLLTLNPLGSMVAHAGQHVAAVVHAYDGDTYLPPHASAPALSLEACSIGFTPARCGTLEVPENPSQPDGAKIPLRVAVVPARSDDPRPDPIFWFAGWGGAGVTDDAADVLSAFVQVNVDRDLVFVDQRGTGSSELLCPLPDERLVDAAPAHITAAARRCAERIGPNLRYYTSVVAVDDFDAVRRALGYDRVNLYGGSYGVTTGLIYLLRHGDHVRSAVFDSGSLLDVHIFEQQARNKQRALEALFSRCAADPACHTAFPKVRREFRQIVTRLARGPFAVPGTDVVVDAAGFASAVDDLTAYTPGKAAAPRLLHLLAAGRLSEAAGELTPSGPARPLAYQLLIQCNEPWASWRPAEVARNVRGTYLAPAFVRAAAVMQAACKGFPKAAVPPEIGRRVRSSVPVLFLNGAEDGADPPANVANARRELPRSRTVVFPAAGHGQLGLMCAQDLIAQFVERGEAAGLDASCAKTAALQPFDTRK